MKTVDEMHIELKMLRFRIIKKTNGANIHKARNLLGAATVIIDQYEKTKDPDWIGIYEEAIHAIIDFLNEE